MKMPSSMQVALVSASLLGCGGGGESGPQATFAIIGTASGGKQALEAVPWPSDLLRDATGHISLDTLPLEDNLVRPELVKDLQTEQDGFGVFSGAYFPIGRYAPAMFGNGAAVDADAGTVDVATLDGNVHLLPLSCTDASTTIPKDELPVYVHLRAQDQPQRIYARPERGVVLHERCTYAYVVTRAVHTTKGALVPSDDLAALLLDATPEGRLSDAYKVFAPLRTRLASGPIRVADVAAATVFTTHSLTKDYLAARGALILAGKPKVTVTRVFARDKTAADDGTLDELFGTPAIEQPGIDNAGGMSHAGIDYVVQGSFESLDFLGGTTKNALGIDATAIGIVEHTGDALKVKGTIAIPFTLVVPKGADLTKLPFAVVQHGLGVQRRWVMSTANTLAVKGIASILIDLPFHGARAADAVDTLNELTMAMTPDGFAESTLDPSLLFFNTGGNKAAGIPGLLPRSIRAHFFQAVVDILQAFRLMSVGDLSAIGAREPRLATLAIDSTREAYVGESFGSMIGTIVSAFEPKLVVSVLDVGGGGTVFPLLLNSAKFAPIFGTLLNAGLGTHAGDTDDPRDTDWGYNLGEMLLDGGDSLAYAPYVIGAQSWPVEEAAADAACNVLQLSAYRDELVPNPANLALARGLGLQPLTLGDGVAPDLTGWPGVTPSSTMLTGNGAGGRTAAFIQFHEAAHGMMTERVGAHVYDLSSAMPPFPMRATPVPIDNPIDRVHAIVGAFVAAGLAGQAPTVQ